MTAVFIFIGILIISAILLELSGVPTEMVWIISDNLIDLKIMKIIISINSKKD
jgi:hypothetical protein